MESKSEKRVVVRFGENGQLAADCRIQNFTASFFVGVTREGVTDLGSIKVGQLPADAFAKIIRRDMIRVIALGHNGFVRLAFGCEIMVHADQDDLLDAHVKSQLKCNVGDSCTFPNTPADIGRKAWTSIRCVKESWQVGKF